MYVPISERQKPEMMSRQQHEFLIRIIRLAAFLGCLAPGDARSLVTDQVDGGWSEWSSFGQCCEGTQLRSRTCTDPFPSYGGSYCIGEAFEVRACQVEARCETHNYYPNWQVSQCVEADGSESEWTEVSSLEECCGNHFNWEPRLSFCLGNSDGWYYPNWKEGRCVPADGSESVELEIYPLEVCCNVHFYWDIPKCTGEDVMTHHDDLSESYDTGYSSGNIVDGNGETSGSTYSCGRAAIGIMMGTASLAVIPFLSI